MQFFTRTAPLLRKPLPSIIALAAAAALGLAAPAAQAQTAYVDTYNATTGAFVFGTINLQTGLFTNINSDLDSALYALGFGADGNLYGLAPDANLTGTNLYQVSKDTGAETLLTNFAGYQVYGGSIGANGLFTAITAASPTTNHSTLFTVDPVAKTLTSGARTFAAADGLAVADGSGGVYVSDLSSTDSGFDGLDFVDTTLTHPSTAYVGDTGLLDVYTGLLSGGKLYTFGIDVSAPGTPVGVYTLDTATGAATFVATTSNNEDVYAAAIAPASVPEASTTITFGLLLVLGGLAVTVRKKTARSAGTAR